MEIKRLCTLAIGSFKTINNINLSFTRDPKIRPYDILVKLHKSAKYGDKSLIDLGLKIWNQFPSNVKSLTPITNLRNI